MDMMEIIYTFIINVVPIIILLIPYFFIRNISLKNLYFRIFLGILVFYLIYWVLPIIFQLDEPPKKLEISSGEEGNTLLGITYIVSHFVSLITSFASYPLITLPFIFFVAPFISLILVWNRLRKSEGKVRENLALLSYQLNESPSKRIREELVKNDWTREKEILKLLIVLSPISLYLLQVIIKVSGSENVSLQSSLGWFLEILFVYLATFIFSIELLANSQVSLKGKYFGDSIREQTYKSLYTVGAPISVLSVILFIADNIQTLEILPIVLYFFAYFIMASIIFILFLKIFEPISILIFIKLIDWWKHKKLVRKKIDYSNTSYIAFFSLLALATYFIIYLLISFFIYEPFLTDPAIQESGNYNYPFNPTLVDSIKFEMLIIFGFINIIIALFSIGLLFAHSLKFIKNIRLGVLVYLPITIVISIFLIGKVEYWLTGQTSYTDIFGVRFSILRTASFKAELVGLLYGLSIPYLYTRYIFNAVIWGLLFYYIKKDFKSKNIPIDEFVLEKIMFSTISDFFSITDYSEEKTNYLISKNKDIISKEVEGEREEILALLNNLEEDKLLREIKPKEENESKRFYFTLKYLYRNKMIDIWKPEFSFTFERVEKQGLYIIYEDGRGIFNYPFVHDFAQDPGLVSGMFSAITSFIKEMTKSTEVLKKIDHGDITILLEYGTHIFGALFIKGNESGEVRARLKKFVNEFEMKYSTVLKEWSGALIHFKDDNALVEDIFKEE